MAEKEKDERFSRVFSDPRFRTLRKSDKTLKIDNRFKSMFTEDKFKLKYSMDKRGKPKKHLIAEDYKQFYRLSDEENDQLDIDNDTKVEPSIEAKIDEHRSKNNSPNLAHKFGYHRGLTHSDTDSDSSSSSESEESSDEEEVLEHKWGELDQETKPIEKATSRIAICNADWDRINAQDLFVLLNSFKRSTGIIHYIRIYYSQFGEQRLKIEEQKGPSEFIFGKVNSGKQNDLSNELQVVESNSDHCNEEQSEVSQTETSSDEENNDDEEEDDDDDKDDPKQSEAMERLRRYQLERLKYFYAVVAFDSSETAEVIYNELDGLEYESSSTTLDIRFIPEDMTFDDVTLKEECVSMPNSNYKAPAFINTALQQSKVKLTWDETDHKRKSAFAKAFDKENEDDLKHYLASSSEDEDYDEDEEEIVDPNLQEGDKINKYKDLLRSLDQEKEEEFEMKVTWEPGLKTAAQDLINKPKQPHSKANQAIPSESDDSDSELHLHNAALNDDNSEQSDVSSSLETNNIKNDKRKKKFKQKKEKLVETNTEDASQLELLMMNMDGNEDKRHFNYKKIIEANNKRQDNMDKDSFKFDAEDPRFNAIFTSHLYSIDQSDPNFKKTEAFEQILKKNKDKASKMVNDEQVATKPTNSKNSSKPQNSWGSLVNRVKNRTSEQMNKRKPICNVKFESSKKFKHHNNNV